MQTYCDERSGQLSFMPIPPMFSKEGELWKRFLDFHKQYPKVYENFKEKILERMDGKTILSSYEVRQIMVTTDIIGVDNNFAPYYLRTFLEDFPQYEEFFRLRSLKQETI